KGWQRMIEDNNVAYNKARTKKSDEQMVQMYREIEDAVKGYAGANGFHAVFHFSEPLTDADKYSPQNVQRKLVGPGSSGGVCPLYFADCMDVSADVVRQLNALYPAPAAPVAASPAPAGGGPAPGGKN